MITDELIERTRKYLFSTKEEMDADKVPASRQERLFRLRDMYTYWLRHNTLRERDIVRELKRRYGIGDTKAYEDLRLVKLCLGELNQCTRDYMRYRMCCMIEESYAAARAKGDTASMVRAANVYGKYARLDKDEPDALSYDQIVPAAFEMSSDPSLVGIRPVKDWRARAAKLEKRFIEDLDSVPEAEEIQPLEKTFNEKDHDDNLH